MPLKWGRVPSWSATLIAILAHVVALRLLLTWHTQGVHITHTEYQIAQRISGSPRLVLNPRLTPGTSASARMHARIRPTHIPRVVSVPPGTPAQILQEQARRSTAALSQAIRFRQIYGFYPGHDYQLPIRTTGEPPFISPDRVPPHFEQFVTVEITINVDGRVADAHIVSGQVDPPIQKTLLSAIREFKYKPATRDGIPIPSQLDIVVHIPS